MTNELFINNNTFYEYLLVTSNIDVVYPTEILQILGKINRVKYRYLLNIIFDFFSPVINRRHLLQSFRLRQCQLSKRKNNSRMHVLYNVPLCWFGQRTRYVWNTHHLLYIPTMRDI